MKKRILLMMCIISLIITGWSIVSTYSKYSDEASGSVENTVGRWNIKLNNTDITQGSSYNFVINQITIDGNNNVAPGKIAPGLSGYFDINIDPSNTDVSIKYEITVNPENLEGSNIHIVDINEINNNTLIQTGENSYTGVILLQDIQQNTQNTVRIEIEWESDSDEDAEDYNYALSHGNVLEIPIAVNVKQYTGETITPFE